VEEFLEKVPGARALCEWFGDWPSFHDAEVIGLSLEREAPSELRVKTWRMTNRTDTKGYFVLEKHVEVIFRIEEIADLELFGFSVQNVISGLILSEHGDGVQIELGPCYGLAGKIIARGVSISFKPEEIA